MKGFAVLTQLLIAFTMLQAENFSFITDKEYASQLYHSPRGISCYKCHGEKGEGKVIATYKDKGEKKSFAPPAINQLKAVDFEAAFKKRQKGMPRYFLTDEEIRMLYLYLHPKKVDDDNS